MESYADGSLPLIIADKIGISRSEGIGAANIMADSVRTGRPIGDILREKITREKSLYGTSTTEAWANKLEDISPNSSTGRMYEVNIKANPEDFLDWDKPLSQQSEKVRAAIEEWLGPEYANSTLMTGANLAPTKGGTNKLPEIGIPGIKYLDQGSRVAGEGSRNYVVFDDALVEILRKYGLLPLIAAGAAGGAPQEAAASERNPN
jgi:hypothetical protein